MSNSSPTELSPDKQALIALRKLRARLDELERARTEPIAIVGMACRFPGGADTPEAFWRLLHGEVDAVREVPADRWDVDAYYDPDPDAAGKIYTRYGAFLDNVDRFDAQFFRIAPREAVSMDPQQRLLLEVGWEALEHAGCAPEDIAGSDTGVFVGLGTSDYSQLLLEGAATAGVDTYFGTGNAFSAAVGRLAYVLGFHGPAIAVDTACSSSLVALHLACQSLRARECSLALAGGVNAILTPAVTQNFCRARMLAADGRCKTFDAAANGYVRGEGCGVIVLKRLSAAVTDGDRILAVIRGSAVNQDGRSGGFTAPNEAAQTALIRKALAVAAIEPNQVGYVEAHGTGTSLGDPIEAHALAAAFAGRPADSPLVVGSVKTNIGHLEAAAGIAGVIKVALALQHRLIPRHLHFKTLNPQITLDGFPLVVASRATEWRPIDGARLAGISSFGFSGTNAHVLLEEAPPQPAAGVPEFERPTHILALSARDENALRTAADRYAALIAAGGADIADICHTANVGRSHFDERLAVVGNTPAEFQEALAGFAATGQSDRVVRGTRAADREVAFLFTGQGAQYAGMGRTLYDTQPVFRQVLDTCDELLRTELEQPLLSVLYPRPGEHSPIDATGYTQVGLFAFEYALSELWRSWGVQPAAVLGHSVGEYVAACVAGVFSLEQALRLVAARGRLMQGLPAGGAMAAVRADERLLTAVLQDAPGRVAIAATNGPENTVISGDEAAVDAVLARLAARNIAARRLSVSHAFHSPLVEPMLDAFEQVASRSRPAPARLVIASNLTGRLAPTDFAWNASYWRRQARERVRFAEAVSALHEQGARVFLEIGPQPTLIGVAQTVIRDGATRWLPSLRRGSDAWSTLGQSVAQLYALGANIDWAGFDRNYRRRTVTVPTYPFQRERFWPERPTRRGSTPATGEETETATPLLYDVRWLPRAHSPEAEKADPGSWVLLADRSGVARRVGEEMVRRGVGCQVVDFCDREEWSWLDANAPGIAGVLDCRALDVADASDVPQALADAARVLVRLRQAASHPRLWMLTRGAQTGGGSDARVAPPHAPVWGFGRVAALEHADLWGGLIDLDPQPRPDDDAPAVVDHLLAPDGEDQVAYRDGQRFVARLERIVTPRRTALTLSADAVYLITGGTGGLGLHVARRFVERGARRLVLVSRSGLPPRAHWESIEASSPQGVAIVQVRAMENAGASVAVLQADVSDDDAVARMIRDIRAGGVPLRGVVHAAGTAAEFPISKSSAAAIDDVMRSKTTGAWLLHEATKDEPLDFFVMFSSVSAIWGSKGLAAYAAANHFLDALAHHRRGAGRPALSVNWGPWTDGGMMTPAAREHLAQLGVDTLAPAEALDTLETLIGAGASQAIVARVDWGRFASIYTARARRPLLDSLVGRSSERAIETGSVGDDRVTTEATAASERESLVAAIMAADEAGRVGAVRELLQRQVATVLRLPTVKATSALTDLGIDSLMAIELRNEVQRSLGVLVPMVSFLNGSTLETLVEGIAASLTNGSAEAVRAPGTGAHTSPAALTGAQAEALLGRVHELSEAEVDALLSALGTTDDAR